MFGLDAEVADAEDAVLVRPGGEIEAHEESRATESRQEGVRRRISPARRLLAPFLEAGGRTLPRYGSPACATCEFSKGEVCCRREGNPGEVLQNKESV